MEKYIEDELIEHQEIPFEEYHAIKNMTVKKACVYIFRLAPWPIFFMNHFGVLLELENG